MLRKGSAAGGMKLGRGLGERRRQLAARRMISTVGRGEPAGAMGASLVEVPERAQTYFKKKKKKEEEVKLNPT